MTASSIAARLRESEARFRALTTATSDVVYRMSPDWREMRQLDGRGFIVDTDSPSIAWIDEYLLPEDQAAILAVIQEAVDSKGVFQLEHRVRRADGSVGWTFSRAVPILDASGEIMEWFGAATDVSARHEAEEHLRLVVNALNHRVKNNLATVQAIAAQTFRNADDLVQAEAAFVGRIEALALATDFLTGAKGPHPSMRLVLEEAVRSHRPTPERCRLAGPDINLLPKTAQAVSLAIHELATNALKHGAWSAPHGEVAVDWSSVRGDRGERRLRLTWSERGGPPVSPPVRRGFGSRLIEQGLAQELKGQVRLVFDPTGLACLVDAPLA
ncbi:sensor histidine kinase [Phenylobacterium sp.]|uniref:sensor histidine kinase n=1 Tax=Phenylobacterium sp. TaxID=1871053 RepID=UPI002EDA8E1E